MTRRRKREGGPRYDGVELLVRERTDGDVVAQVQVRAVAVLDLVLVHLHVALRLLPLAVSADEGALARRLVELVRQLLDVLEPGSSHGRRLEGSEVVHDEGVRLELAQIRIIAVDRRKRGARPQRQRHEVRVFVPGRRVPRVVVVLQDFRTAQASLADPARQDPRRQALRRRGRLAPLRVVVLRRVPVLVLPQQGVAVVVVHSLKVIFRLPRTRRHHVPLHAARPPPVRERVPEDR
mmetsp:Transcript_2096/g.6215  ORF Transcript_2096/g.6215 Transcript_2096/m.6215 type:complete len:236 (+) Transcript_2096:1474-2181(+)